MASGYLDRKQTWSVCPDRQTDQRLAIAADQYFTRSTIKFKFMNAAIEVVSQTFWAFHTVED